MFLVHVSDIHALVLSMHEESGFKSVVFQLIGNQEDATFRIL